MKFLRTNSPTKAGLQQGRGLSGESAAINDKDVPKLTEKQKTTYAAIHQHEGFTAAGALKAFLGSKKHS